MATKLHERFARVVSWDRESFHCESCDKVRAKCGDCERCSECCTCEYCSLCGLPNGWQSECTCFQCDACARTCPESENVLDDGNYDRDYIMIGEEKAPIQYVCTKCYERRRERSVLGLDPRGK